ncbi:MAG: V-type ATPase subunit [Candidatus Parvarchaeota archaeon]
MEPSLAGAYGNARALYTDLLKPAELDALKGSSRDHFLSVLETTNYKREIDLLYNQYKLPELIDVVVNTHFVANCNRMMMLQPLFGRDVISAYLSKIDLQNIKLILAAKMMGKSLELTESTLSVNRGFGLSILSPLMTKEDYLNLINQRDVNGMINYLTRYRYGRLFLRYASDEGLSAISKRIDEYYYATLLDSVRFFDGTEGPIIRFIRSLIDIRNVILVMRRIENGNLAYKGGFLHGNIDMNQIQDATKMEDVLSHLPFKLDQALEDYKKEGLLSVFERSMKSQINRYYLGVFRQSANSVGFLLSFILNAEIERDTIREAWFKIYYGMEAQSSIWNSSI